MAGYGLPVTRNHLVPRWGVPFWARITWISLLAGLAAATGMVQVLDRKLPSDTWSWVHRPSTHIWLVGALSVLTLLDTIRRAIFRFSERARMKKKAEIRKQLSALAAGIAKITGQPIEDIGCGLFLVQRRWFGYADRLVRFERVRLIDNVPASDVKFTKGKGTVGECWQNQRKAHDEWDSRNERYANRSLTDEEWNQLAEEDRRGFTREEWVSLVGKYSEVVAMPVMVDEKFRGCLAVDRRWYRSTVKGTRRLDEDDVATSIGAISQTLGPTLSP